MTRLAEIGEALPGAARLMVQLAVDNPGAMVTGLAGLIVLEKAAYNLVRPRGPVEAAAFILVMSLGAPYLAAELIRRGVLQVKFRDPAGCLVDARDVLAAGDETGLLAAC